MGRYADKHGRRAALTLSVLLMCGGSLLIAVTPSYAKIGLIAPAMLVLARLLQGLSVGGEYGASATYLSEMAGKTHRGFWSSFQYVTLIMGQLLALAMLLLLQRTMAPADLESWGWRIPFLASLLLVWVGLYVRLQLTETPAFKATLERNERVEVPLVAVLRDHGAILGLATLAAVTTFVVFYLMTVFTLSCGTSQLGFVRQDFLILQIISVSFFGLTIPLSAKLADRFGRVEMLIAATLLIIVFGLAFGPLFSSANSGRVLLMLSLGLACMGLTYGPLGTTLAAVFPTSVRYTGASLAFNLAGILGGSLAPYIATWLAGNYGIAAVGYYLCGAGTVSLVALLLIKRRGS